MAKVGVDSPLEVSLREEIQKNLNLYLSKNATFLAERLIAENASEENVFLLATCFYKSSHLKRAISLLKGSKSTENRYLLAMCYYETNQYQEAEEVLLLRTVIHESGPLFMKDELMSTDACAVPNGAAGLYLLGCICRQTNRQQHAIDYFMISLQLDPFLWTSFEALCELGADVEASSFFGASTCFIDTSPEYSDISLSLDDSREFGTPQLSSDQLKYFTPSNCMTPIPPKNLTFNSDSISDTPKTLQTPVQNNSSVSNWRTKVNNEAINFPCGKKPSGRFLQRSEMQPRRIGRLSFSTAQNSPDEQSVLPNDTTDVSIDDSGRHAILCILSSFGEIYKLLCKYMCKEALSLLQSLQYKQLNSGWSQHQIGRAYFEMVEYNKAEKVFRKLHQLEPYRMKGLDIFSTCLWHLKKEVDMCYLAQEVTEMDRKSCEAWCVVGNCFSLQKEHETALKFFKRAIQLNPSYTYAFTLCGHEHVANEDFEKAIACYRHAIRCDSRHYNAWYGLGTIYFRQEKYQQAEYHFRRALQINPRSSLLYCYLGMVLHSNKKFDEALSMLEKATIIQPTNPQARFQRANIFITQNRLEEALYELKEVQECAPKESSVHFLMGKVCKKLGRIDEAMQCFTTALYFHPKDNNLIKVAMDRLHEESLDEDEHLEL